MPSLDQLKDKDKFNGSDDPDSIPFATYLGLVTARCVQQDIGHVLVDTDPNQRTRCASQSVGPERRQRPSSEHGRWVASRGVGDA